jgi:hypothetical protein
MLPFCLPVISERVKTGGGGGKNTLAAYFAVGQHFYCLENAVLHGELTASKGIILKPPSFSKMQWGMQCSYNISILQRY